MVLTSLGRYEAAIAAYDQAIALDPKNLNAYFNCAALYERTGNLTGAIERISTALQVEPGNTTLTDILNRLKAARDKHPSVVPILPGATLQ